MKISAFIAVSLDVYIAREDGGLDWLPGPEEGNGEDYGYQKFFDSVDLLVIGRKTFEKVLSFDTWPYGNKRVFVLSHQEVEIPALRRSTVKWSNSSLVELVREFARMGVHNVYVDGGRTIQGFLAAGLLDELTISWIPVLIGKGIPLFGHLEKDFKLNLIENRSYKNGIVQSRYETLH